MTRKEYIEDPALQVQESLLLKLFPPAASLVIFDIGACEGESSVRYSRLFPNAAVHAFEPLPANFNWIRKHIEYYRAGGVVPHQLCLSDQPGEIPFFVSAGKPEGVADADWDYGNKSSSILPPGEHQAGWLRFNEQVLVPATTLKQFCAENQIGAVDFIHMDVQGAELMVLDGAGDFIRNIRAIWLEVEAVELYKGQPLKEEVEAYLETRGFIKLADTVYDTAGDQFWVCRAWALDRNLEAVIRNIRLRFALRALWKRSIRRIQRLWKR